MENVSNRDIIRNDGRSIRKYIGLCCPAENGATAGSPAYIFHYGTTGDTTDRPEEGRSFTWSLIADLLLAGLVDFAGSQQHGRLGVYRAGRGDREAERCCSGVVRQINY